jgi:hypothetical protein
MRPSRNRSLARFVLRTFLWLPPCFALWYFTSRGISAAAAVVAELFVHGIAPGIVSAIEHPGVELAFVTTIEVVGAPGRAAFLVPEVNPLAYTYGLALFLALMLATRSNPWKILGGGALLMLFAGWGIAFDFLAHVGVKLGPEIALQAGLAGWRSELVALGYQLGVLVVPGLAPIVLWAAFNRAFIARLTRKSRGRVTKHPDPLVATPPG